ncbi:hypothetical protein C8R47DRAFT_1314108 [Mycena vitilis]|nr:hypothetical protein C8R47DRAFT_1314108 [Mycena vitilis]
MPAALEVYDAKQFPRTLFRSTANLEPTLYQFGILVSDKLLIDYAVKEKLANAEEVLKRPLHGLCAISRAIERLQAVAQARLTHTRASGTFGRGNSVLALYSNYNMSRRRLVEDDEQDVIETIQQELGIKDSPRWYWDWTNDFPDADAPSLN